METQKHLRVLVVEDSINAAQELINVVRNLGHAVRDSRADDPETLHQALAADQFDVVFCATTIAELPIENVRAAMNRIGAHIPLIAYGEDLSPAAVVDNLHLGATALVSKSVPDHLEMILGRELGRLDIERRLAQAEAALAQSERRCQSLLDSSQDAIAYVLDGMHIYANQMYLHLFGFSDLADIDGTPIMDMVEPEDSEKLKGFLARYARGDKSARDLDVRGVSQGGARLNIGMEFSDATYEDEECIQVVIRDYTATRKLESQVADLITRDQLTGLYNRHYFVDAVDDAIAGERRQQAGLIFVELDGITGLKEQLGLSGTDVVLREVATVIAQSIGESGVVARLTDVAFTVLLMDAARLGQVADQLVKAIAEHSIKVDGDLLQVSVSVGSAMLAVLPNEADAALDGVEQACADARAAGGNTHRAFRIAKERFAQSDTDDKALAKCVRDAITSRRLKLLFQPIASLRGEPGERYEAQLRMLNEKRDEIHPRQFMAAAIRFQLAPSLDRWVLLTVMARCVQRRKENKKTEFFLKIAPTTVLDPKFLPWLKDQLGKARLDGRDLVLEITETTILEHLAESKAFHAAAKKLGCRIAIDNFGLSSGALKLLKHIHPDFVRVHGELVEVIHEDDNALRKVGEIAKAVSAMGSITIATHVNDAVLLPVLWQAGADLMQGAFLQEPGENLTFDFVGEMF
ncbi:MAG: EAL domain-containing protein [Gammaproteobacteria bacterium]|nr:EAL domain-containing protein [Gammaproteobacteria bacterium]MCP5136904.1 EAL domain-containing protein [Gammaproteobacteria bacterium]